jgi:hypothetical protein
MQVRLRSHSVPGHLLGPLCSGLQCSRQRLPEAPTWYGLAVTDTDPDQVAVPTAALAIGVVCVCVCARK